MRKYRGTRGFRDYIRESRELKKPAFILIALCATVSAFAGAVFAYSFLLPGRDVVEAAAEVELFAETETYILEETEIIDTVMRDMLPIIPLLWSGGVFFDTYTNRLYFPRCDYQAEQISYKKITVTFPGLEFPLRYLPLPYSALVMRIIKEGSEITIQTRSGVFIEHGETESHMYIQLIDPRDEYRTIVVIDAGHGGDFTGASSVLGGNALNESQINFIIKEMLLEIFDEPDILLIPTRTDNYFISTAERTAIANGIGDYFISIHCNADSRSSRSSGTLTLFGAADGSEELARVFQDALVSALGSPDRGIHYTTEFYILRESNVPVILLELLFLSNPDDASRLSDPQTQMLIAQTLAETIARLR